MFDDSRSRDNARGEGTTGGLPPLLPERLVPAVWSDPTAAYTFLLQGLGDGTLASAHFIDSLHQVAIQSSAGAFIKYDTPLEFFNELTGAILSPFRKHGRAITDAPLPVIGDDHQVYEVHCHLTELERREWKVYKLSAPAHSKIYPSIMTASPHPEELFDQVKQLLQSSSVKQIREASTSLMQRDKSTAIEIGNIINRQHMEEIVRHVEQHLQPVLLLPYPIDFEFQRNPNDRLDGLTEYEGGWIVLVKYGHPISDSDISS